VDFPLVAEDGIELICLELGKIDNELLDLQRARPLPVQRLQSLANPDGLVSCLVERVLQLLV